MLEAHPGWSESKREAVQAQLNYLENHAEQTRYGEYRAKGWFIGSGVIEAGCKAAVGRCLKQSGMFWSKAGAEDILGLRCLVLGSHFDAAWKERRSLIARQRAKATRWSPNFEKRDAKLFGPAPSVVFPDSGTETRQHADGESPRSTRGPPWPNFPTISMTPEIPLEDFFEDIIAKSMRGRHLSESELAERTGVPRDVLARLCRGEFCDESALAKVARALSLEPRALTMAASKVWRPRPVSLQGLEVFNMPYRDMRVNAFLVWDPATRAAAFFDTATDSAPLAGKARELDLSVESIFLTHTHNDHIAALDGLQAAFPGAMTFSNQAEAWPGTETFAEGAVFPIGALKVSTRTTSGHSNGGTTYFVEGLSRPIAIVGDAIFAGSMGGGMVSFVDAWKNNREKILTLPDETVLCPGHGPLSSVAEEKRHNPFFATEFLE